MITVTGTITRVIGPTCFAVSAYNEAGTFFYFVSLYNVVARDPNACENWCSENLIGQDVICFVHEKNRLGRLTAEVEFEGGDVGELLVAQGMAD